MSEALHQLLISQRMSRPGTLHGITVDSRYLYYLWIPLQSVSTALSPAGAVSMPHVKLITTVRLLTASINYTPTLLTVSTMMLPERRYLSCNVKMLMLTSPGPSLCGAGPGAGPRCVLNEC